MKSTALMLLIACESAVLFFCIRDVVLAGRILGVW